MNHTESIVDISKQLSTDDQKTLLQFAKFLLSNDDSKPCPVTKQQLVKTIVPPQKDESVVKAISRLKATYFMLSPDDLMNDITKKMTEHLIKGKKKSIIINELETIFKQKYQSYLEKFK